MTPTRLPTSGSLAMKLAAAVLVPLAGACADTPTSIDTESSGPDVATVDAVMTAFMKKYSIPGLSLAITKDERLVYSKAYGRADDTRALTTKDRFRIASVSKPVTSVAIMRLVELGRLSLDRRVFGAGGVLGTTYGTEPYGAGITSITVDHLLHHTGGGWSNVDDDPMLTNLSMSIDQLISWTLDNRPLASTPGSAYVYSNFGYAVLGRVIERVTGTSYASAVKTLVLDPAGITDMAIAGNTLADRQANEVRYYGQNGENPYSRNVAHGLARGLDRFGDEPRRAARARGWIRRQARHPLRRNDRGDDHGERCELGLRGGVARQHLRRLVARGDAPRNRSRDQPNRLPRQLQLRDPD